MKIAVIAANGRLGKAIVQRALAAGHSVRAGVHHNMRFPEHAHLEVVRCDATNVDDVTALIAGQDAVVSAIGHVRGSKADVQAVAVQVLIDAMHSRPIKRFVTVTGTGVRFPGDYVTILDRLANFAVGIIDPQRMKDGRAQTKLLQTSTLNWTLIRVLKLQNGPVTPFRLTLHGPTKLFVSRTEVADAILQVLVEQQFLRESPIISKK